MLLYISRRASCAGPSSFVCARALLLLCCCCTTKYVVTRATDTREKALYFGLSFEALLTAYYGTVEKARDGEIVLNMCMLHVCWMVLSKVEAEAGWAACMRAWQGITLDARSCTPRPRSDPQRR